MGNSHHEAVRIARIAAQLHSSVTFIGSALPIFSTNKCSSLLEVVENMPFFLVLFAYLQTPRGKPWPLPLAASSYVTYGVTLNVLTGKHITRAIRMAMVSRRRCDNILHSRLTRNRPDICIASRSLSLCLMRASIELLVSRHCSAPSKSLLDKSALIIA